MRISAGCLVARRICTTATDKGRVCDYSTALGYSNHWTSAQPADPSPYLQYHPREARGREPDQGRPRRAHAGARQPPEQNDE
jgi:hypothetical protein